MSSEELRMISSHAMVAVLGFVAGIGAGLHLAAWIVRRNKL